jgi:hypothetical protein
MSQKNDSGILSIVAGAARAAHLRVYNSSGTWTTADATHAGDGVQTQPSFVTTDIVSVDAVTKPGTVKMTASGVIAIGATVYAAAAGKIADAGTIIEGRALEAAGADGDIIEVIPMHNRDVSTATTGTTAATFQVDSDLGKPRAGLKSQTGGTGDFVAYINAPATLGADRIFTLVGDANANIVNEATAQTLTNKTLTAPVIGGMPTWSHTVTPVAAAGSTVADAAALPDTLIAHITSDGAGKGVLLPAVTGAGVMRIVVNNSSTAAEIYAESGGTINGAAADASMVIPASKGVLCISTAAKTWIAFDLTAKATAS